jgi:hypothetical protein
MLPWPEGRIKPEQFLITNNQFVGRDLCGPWARIWDMKNLCIFAIERSREKEKNAPSEIQCKVTYV